MVGVGFLAEATGKSTATVYRWCLDTDNSGLRNPIDLLDDICLLVGGKKVELAETIAQHYCELADGFFVKNSVDDFRLDVFKAFPIVLQKFARYMEAVSDGLANGVIEETEAERVRQEWEDVKRISECFVRNYEKSVSKEE